MQQNNKKKLFLKYQTQKAKMPTLLILFKLKIDFQDQNI